MKKVIVSTSEIAILKNHISDKKYFLSFLPAIKEVAEQFDGKVLNKRFYNAIMAKFSYMDGEHIRRPVTVVKDSMDYVRIHIHPVKLTNFNEGYIFDWPVKYIVNDKKLNASAFIEHLNKYESSTIKEIAILETECETAANIIEEYNKVAVKLDSLGKSMTYQFKRVMRSHFEPVYNKAY